jgi:hypothetical protein
LKLREGIFVSMTNRLVVATAAGMLLFSGCLMGSAVAVPAASKPDAQAAPNQAQPKQVQLTQKDIDGVIAAQPEADAILSKEENGPTASDIPKLDAVAKKHGFDSYEQMSGVDYSIGLVMDGIDAAGAYVGPKAVLNEQIKQLDADKTVSAKDKKEELADLQQQLQDSDQAEQPLPANIDAVKQNLAKLNAVDQSN